MKTNQILKTVLCFTLILTTYNLYSQELPTDDGVTDAPIDGFIGCLTALGLGYGAYKKREQNDHKKH